MRKILIISCAVLACSCTFASGGSSTERQKDHFNKDGPAIYAQNDLNYSPVVISDLNVHCVDMQLTTVDYRLPILDNRSVVKLSVNVPATADQFIPVAKPPPPYLRNDPQKNHFKFRGRSTLNL